jgi:hypothetical protein
MSWDQRGYYYRSRRVAGRPVREYVGAGLLAQLQADLDEAERQEQVEKRAQDRARLHADEARYQPLDNQVQEVFSAAETLAKLALLTAGYRQHDRGRWRRRRPNG